MTTPLILIAEEQPDARRQACEYLEQCGFRVISAASASDIWAAIKAEPVRALVLDAALRGLDGMDLCRDVRERSDVPMILVGAGGSEVDRVVSLELGADDYMAKPYSNRELVARLRAVLRRSRKDRLIGLRARTLARFDGWQIDFARREVQDEEGDPIALTAAEFALLQVLLDHPQMVIPRARLMELAGVRDAPSSDRSIDVLVSRVRRKLSRAGKIAPIVTVRGAGYMLSAPVERQ